MADYSFKLPDIGEGIAEAEIVAWHVAVGDVVEEDAPLADVMTDKATIEMTAPVSGRIVSLAGAVGDQIAIGSILTVFDVEADDAEPAEPPLTEAPTPPPDAIDEVAQPAQTKERESLPAARSEAVSDVPASPTRDVRVLASPTVRQRAKDLGVDLAEVKPSVGDRIRHSDLDAYLTYNAGAGYGGPRPRRQDEQVRVIGLRRRIAENMAASKRAIPHFSYVEEIDVTKLEALRADLNAARGARPKLTMLPLLIVGICRALPAFPMINARYDDEAGIVTRSGAVHLGIATQTDAGLMVPVVRDADTRNIWQLAGDIVRLAEAARTGKTRPDELSGSTLTITSLGPLGGIATTPVINRPEVAIIGPNRIVERPLLTPDDRIVRVKLMNLSISCDHRVVDGWDAASFVQAVKRLLETPALLLTD